MDKAELRKIIREELEKMFTQYALAISYDITEVDDGIKNALSEKLKELGGELKNESLYTFTKTIDSKNIINEIKKILSSNAKVDSKTEIFSIRASNNQLIFEELTK